MIPVILPPLTIILAGLSTVALPLPPVSVTAIWYSPSARFAGSTAAAEPEAAALDSALAALAALAVEALALEAEPELVDDEHPTHSANMHATEATSKLHNHFFMETLPSCRLSTATTAHSNGIPFSQGCLKTNIRTDFLYAFSDILS